MRRERTPMRDLITYYKDSQGKWRWRVTALENGKVIGMSSESYENYNDAVANIHRLGTINEREFSAKVIDT
jgi:uncharacterized protein YegP (UPF0339 family)